jgi:8-oxo-dGTP pyrophosphatase MutT (NUDIX family)
VTEVPIREAATVVLLRDRRDGTAGMQTWLMRRVPKMAFAAGMSVFPGGSVDTTDGASPELLADRVQAQILNSIAQQLGSTVDHAGRLVCAAIRETFEEVGVLLSQPYVTVDPGLRGAVESRTSGFSAMLTDLGVVLDLSAIRPWARWITPAQEVRRYDTYFFVATLPPGAAAAAVTAEASHADWIGVEQALAEYDAGDRPLLPPTIVTLREMAAYASVAEVLAAAADRQVKPVQPVFHRSSDGALVADLGDGRTVELPSGFIGASGKQP